MTLDLLIIYLTKKIIKILQVATEKWSGTCHDEQTYRQTDGQTESLTRRFFPTRIFEKILDFRSVRFAKRNISPLEDDASVWAVFEQIWLKKNNKNAISDATF